ncbi:hypothetical protein [Halorientalis litorea]|uniref:hypothetical protein n=1 Tax=Halorientalis litorea TaxID=2931977 RepID=UPI001FF20051|nr:hypothetical protein [Halorientalis litorea]
MDPTRRVLLTDGLVGVLALATGMAFAVPFRWWLVPLAGVTTLGTAAVLFSEERDALASRGYAVVLMALFVGLPGLLALGLLWVRPPLGSALAFAVCLGLGGAVVGYRFVFGVLRPVPEKRLARARDRAV